MQRILLGLCPCPREPNGHDGQIQLYQGQKWSSSMTKTTGVSPISAPKKLYLHLRPLDMADIQLIVKRQNPWIDAIVWVPHVTPSRI